MTRSILLALCAPVLLMGCATSTSKPAPICDGHHLRPANPYGSVLLPMPPASGTTAAPAKPSKAGKTPAPQHIAPGGCES